jgi:hypothetical protein
VVFMQRVALTIDDELRRVLNDLLYQLTSKLSLAVVKLESLLKRESEPRPGFLGFASRANKTSFVLKKDTLDGVINDLEKWQRRFDPSWFLLMKIANPIIDRELDRAKQGQSGTITTVPGGSGRSRGSVLPAKSPLTIAGGLRDVLSLEPQKQIAIFLPAAQIETIEIPFSSVKAGRHKSGDNKWYIIDTIVCQPGADVGALSKDVRQLAVKLSQADPIAFGLLNCKGVVCSTHSPPSQQTSAFSLVFRVPNGMEVLQSLRQLLLNSDGHISLSRKIRIARELTKSVSSVHIFNFVHKNIRPESILCFEDTESSQSNTFLVGFDGFRSADGGTNLVGDMAWGRNVYRHPLRQGEHPAEAYKMQHDIYSLGVCLLEIGLWESFVDYTTEHARPQARFGESYSRFQAWLKTRRAITGQGASSNVIFFDALASRLKDYLVELATSKLSPRMGDEYARVVVSCLTCLDEDSDDFDGSLEMVENDSILVGVRFIEKIMIRLEHICV